jgi:hypothetical protein
MPRANVIIYREQDGSVPLVDWLKKQPFKAQNKCTALIELLAEKGNELRRPYVDYLDDGIFELRPVVKRVQYRILYCFVGRNIVLLTHGLVKADKVPISEIDKAIECRNKFVRNPQTHTWKWT